MFSICSKPGRTNIRFQKKHRWFALSLLFLCAGSAFAANSSSLPSFQAGLVSTSDGTCVDVPAAAATPELVLAQGKCGDEQEQLIAFVAQADGYYVLHPPESSNLCIDLDDSGQIVQAYCLPTASQEWSASRNANGSLTLTNEQTHGCLVPTPAQSGAAAALALAGCNGTNAQEFTVEFPQSYVPPETPLLRAPLVLPLAQPVAGHFQAGIFNGLPYRILFPSGYDPSRHVYPIVLFLHGDGERGTDNHIQLRNDLSALATDLDFRAKAPVILVAPQCPLTDSWGIATSPTPTPTEALAVQLVQTLVSTLAVDPDRVAVTGLSMGGVGTWDMISRYPSLFATAAPIAGAGNIADADNLVKVPILAVHGGADSTISPSYDQAMYARIHSLHGAMLYYEIEGAGHDVWDCAYPLTSFWQYISSQRLTH